MKTMKAVSSQMQHDANRVGTMESGNHSKNGVSPKNHKSRVNFLLFIIAILAFGSCTVTSKTFNVYSNVGVKLNAYSNRENVTNKKVAMVVCNDANIPKYDLKNLEFERYVKTMLTAKGYSFTNNNDEANIIIFYEYGISDPRIYTSQQVVPVWGETGISSSKTVVGTSYSGKTYARTTYEPSYGIVGSDVVTNTTTTYLRWANISAFDADYYRETGEDKMIWLTEIQSEGSSDDLRYIFPYLLTAAREYIGENHTGYVSLSSDPVDKRVLEVKNALVMVATTQATSGRKDPQAAVVYDVYRNGELYIKAGTPVSIKRTRQGLGLQFSDFSTTSVYDNKVTLKGSYQIGGKYNDKIRQVGRDLIFGSCFLLLPVGIPLICVGDAHAKMPKEALFYLDME